MDTIWTGLVAGVVAFLATLLTQFLTQRHQLDLLTRELEHQTRAALRDTYNKLLVVQRRSRETSLALARRTGGADAADRNRALASQATAAHEAFVEHYHQLNLDASPEMWIEARGLRDVLDKMLELALGADAGEPATRPEVNEVEALAALARDARQNLERSFRSRLGHPTLQRRNKLCEYDKISRLQPLLDELEAARAKATWAARLRARRRERTPVGR
ncbi:MAG: hypothetical protein LC790_05965 [Actinobacteria bacterium]|nr:hypothetical protein [Actinomycetota bacterium]